MERITVSAGGHWLATASGEPFFWLGDTAWELFHRCTREQVEMYLENRRRLGFNVIQAVALAEIDGLHTPNMYGETPLQGDDPARPNEAYFRHVDFAIRLAAQKGLYIALLPTWADKVTPLWGAGPAVFTTGNARAYGRWLGERYRGDANLVWVLGGDRPACTDRADFRPIWRALAAGIDEGCGFRPLKTYHPMGGQSSSAWLQQEDWLDMHMIQSGHGAGRDAPLAWEQIARDYALSPARPTLDGEINYEDHPVNPWPRWEPANGYFRDHDVRKQAYRSVFAGGCGVTYGHHFVWQMYDQGRQPLNNGGEVMTWQQALLRPAASQMQHLKRLLLSRPPGERLPDQALLVSEPGTGAAHMRATRDARGRYAFVYVPEPDKTIQVDLAKLDGKTRAWWYNPRDGQAVPAGEFEGRGTARFVSPAPGPDSVLVLDAAAQGYPTPGREEPAPCN